MELALSLVLPAYNEAKRLPPYLASVRPYLDARYPGAYEVIVVDDGSTDGLCDVLEPLVAGSPQLHLMRHPVNLGKGAAVRAGILASRGQQVLFADADGATPIDQEARLSDAIAAGADLAVGSRWISGADVTVRRRWTRAITGRLFARLARWYLKVSVRDPQCGFKMFRGDVGRELFSTGRETGFLFDLELLVLAQQRGYRIVEVAVGWTEVPGGHLSLIRESAKILVALPRLKRAPAAGRIANPS